ncbi:hypothetical protein ACQPW1_14700 [Nocardia sp. CA-128927]|uniref:hypothetical protein n=1 Tax=Nocardia sp. CA-128927 TaxID=3239975 RepID=UPI003D97AFDF
MAPKNGDVRIIITGGEISSVDKLSFEYLTQYNPPDGKTYSSYLLYTNAGTMVNHQRFQFVDLKEEADGFSCRLKMTEGYYKDYWLDSKDGYLQAWSSSDTRWRFIDKGPYYHWHQGTGDPSASKLVRVLTEEIAPKAFYIRAQMGEPRDESAQFNILEW